jgi:hypothetical protein
LTARMWVTGVVVVVVVEQQEREVLEMVVYG